ncbi:ketopantoate reductase family protein [Microbacterium sp. NPDC087665]|uniref:ketopantoate reductase family protein n=1 Tax=Microbacterium sp. NPDC087665 TaxID=3364194 RepID=UPI00380435B6
MKVLVYGAGVLGSLYAIQLFEAGVDVTLVARGDRFALIQENGVLVAEGDDGLVRSVRVPVTDSPVGDWDLILVLVRTHQIGAVLETLTGITGDVLFLLNWAAGPGPLHEILGHDRVLLGFPNQGGVMDGDVVRYRPASRVTRLVSMPIGEPDGQTTPRLERIIEVFRNAGFVVKAEPQMDAWLRTHAAFEVPLSVAVHAAGGPDSLAGDRIAVRAMLQDMRQSLTAMPTPTVPGAFRLLHTLPEVLLIPVFRRFLRSSVASPLRTDSPAVSGELATLAEQLRSATHGRTAKRDS